MKIADYVNSLPRVARLTAADKRELQTLLWLNCIVDEVGICILAHDHRSASRLIKLLERGGHYLPR